MKNLEINVGTELFFLLLVALILFVGPSFCSGCQESCGCNDQKPTSGVVGVESITTTSSISESFGLQM